MTSICTKNSRRVLCRQHLRSSSRAFGQARTLAFSLALAASGLLASGLPSAQAANDAYSTNATSGNFSTSFSLGATTPTAGGMSSPASGDSLYFGAAATPTVNNDLTGYTFAGFAFNSAAPAFTIGGNSFTLTGAITNNSTSLQTINNAITLGANESINSAAGAITLGGAISGAFVVSLTGQNAVTLGGTGNSFSGLTLGVGVAANVNNTALIGGVGATVNLSNSQSVGALLVGNGASVINVGANAAITTTTLGPANTSDRFDALNINLGAGASVTTNALNNNGGVLTVGSQFNAVTLNGTDFAANSTNAAGGSLVAATYTNSTATTLANNANVVGAVGLTAGITANSLRFAATTGYTVSVSSTLSLNGAGGGSGAVLMSANSGAVTNTITGGSLYGTSNRGISFLNYDTTTGSSLVIASNILNGPVSGSGTAASTSVLVAGGGVVTFGGANIFNGDLMVAGAGTTLSAGSDSNLGGANSTVSVTAATSGSTAVTLAAGPSNSGSLIVGDVLLGQLVSNISGTTVTLAAAYTGTTIGAATTVGYAEGGTVNLNGGTLQATGTFSLSENGTTATDTTLGVSDVRNRNVGIGLQGGAIDVSAGNTLTIPGVIAGSTGASPTIGALNKVDSGTLAITGTAANTNVYLNNTAGTTTLGKTGGVAATTITVSGGLLQLAGGASGNQTNNLVVNGGTVDLNGVSGTPSSFATLNGAGGTITNNGAAAATLYIGNGGGVYADTLTIGSVISDGTSKLAVNDQGGATSTRVTNFTSANTYSGGTTIGAGTLNIAVNGALGTGNVTIAAGATLTLATGVTAAHNGTTSTSLTLVSTTSMMNLAATTPGTIQDTVSALTINGVAETVPGTYGSAASGASNPFPEFIGNGVIALVPEPSAWVAILGGCGLLALVHRRRVRTA
jgi:fibronectin-binding autotransporter adhesin